jgi:hypothetical protein
MAERLVEFLKWCQMESCAQLKTARLLPLRDGDCGEERIPGAAVFAGSRLSRISPRRRCRRASLQCSPVAPARATVGLRKGVFLIQALSAHKRIATERRAERRLTAR